MKIVLPALLTGIAIIGIVWSIIGLAKVYYNIKTLMNSKKNPHMARYTNGIIYNKKERKLEADQSPITPF